MGLDVDVVSHVLGNGLRVRRGSRSERVELERSRGRRLTFGSRCGCGLARACPILCLRRTCPAPKTWLSQFNHVISHKLEESLKCLTFAERLSAPRRIPPLYFRERMVVPSVCLCMISSLSATMPPSWALRVSNCDIIFFTNLSLIVKDLRINNLS